MKFIFLFLRVEKIKKMKFRNASLLAILFLGFILLINKSKFFSSEEFYKTTTGLNVRAGAGTNYPIEFTLDKDDEIEIISNIGSWYKISRDNKIGFVNGKYLTKGSKLDLSNDLFSSQNLTGFFYFIALSLFAIIVPISIKFYKKRKDNALLETTTDLSRGTPSEKDLVLKLIKNGIPSEHIFHDILIQKEDKSFCQVDLVVITDVGILVIEVKDYSGWIFGKGNDFEWTKTLAGGKHKYVFQNPIIQNKNHIIHVKKQLDMYGDMPYYSLIVFYGNCVLKNINFIPKETYIVKSSRVLDVIQTISKENTPYDYHNFEDVINFLNSAKIKGGILDYQHQHVENINDMLGKNRIFD
jgi:uncharacterized protein YraI